MEPIFRKEAVEWSRRSALGSPRVVVTMPAWLAALLCLLTLVAGTMVLILCPYTRREAVKGELQFSEGPINIKSSASGTIIHRFVTEGSHVKRGQILFSQEIDITSDHGATEEKIIAQLSSEKTILINQQHDEIITALSDWKNLRDSKIKLLNERRFLVAEISRKQRNLEQLQKHMDILRTGLRQGIVTATQIQTQLVAIGQMEDARDQAIQTVQEVGIKIDDTSSKLDQWPVETRKKQGDITKEIADVDQQIATAQSRRILTISAPKDGFVTAISVNEGETVSGSTDLAVILPANHNLIAKFNVQSASMGFIKVGDKTLLKFDAYPFQRYGLYPGTVYEVSKARITTPYAKERVGGDNEQSHSSRFYEVSVKLNHDYVIINNNRISLLSGMDVTAEIIVERTSLWKWIISPASIVSEATKITIQ